MSAQGSAGANDLEGIVDELLEKTSEQERVSVRDVLDAFDLRLFGPLLLIPGVVMVTPAGMVPGMPAVVAAVLVLVAVQRLLGMRRPWAPGWIADRRVERETLQRGFDRARPWLRRVDRFLRPRLRGLTSGPANYVIALLVVGLGATMIPLGFIPFATALPGGAVALLGVAVTAQDGLLALFGYALSAGAVWLALAAL